MFYKEAPFLYPSYYLTLSKEFWSYHFIASLISFTYPSLRLKRIHFTGEMWILHLKWQYWPDYPFFIFCPFCNGHSLQLARLLADNNVWSLLYRPNFSHGWILRSRWGEMLESIFHVSHRYVLHSNLNKIKIPWTLEITGNLARSLMMLTLCFHILIESWSTVKGQNPKRIIHEYISDSNANI